jgi:DNA repair protein RecN (Recombination protein N)
MLLSLTIKNYALIRDLAVDFTKGLSIITGETGAGKSILLGGLSLVLGKRADTTLVYDKNSKCVVEARFDVEKYDLQSVFKKEDLDYDDELIIRREILPNGKSRAFVNDTPTNLNTLSAISSRIIDIHSQHETLQLADSSYQFNIVDSIAGNEELLNQYSKGRKALKSLEAELEKLHEKEARALRDQDYNLFIFQELQDANLEISEQEELESNLEKLSHAEEIKSTLNQITELAERESFGLNEILSSVKSALSKIARYSDAYASLSSRWESLSIEAGDLLYEVESENDQLVHDPSELEKVEARLQLLYGLQKKHAVGSIQELMELKAAYAEKLDENEMASGRIVEIQTEIDKLKTQLEKLGDTLHENRIAALPEFKEKMEKTLSELEMKNTRLRVNLKKGEILLNNGMDELEFEISSDKGATYEKMGRIASGGEMSRLMLAVKFILSQYAALPAIIFDEIDSGVSGEVSNRIADLLLRMSASMQVISITHLPQVASKGQQHYQVFKKEEGTGIATDIKRLNEDERLVHLAEMLGGSEVTDSALAHARQLLS